MQDLLEEQSKAAERHSMRVQELELQVLTATQVHPDIFRLAESALWMLESCAYDSIEVRTSLDPRHYCLMLVLQLCPPFLHLYMSRLFLPTCSMRCPI